MFGIIVSGRSPLIEGNAIDETHLSFTIPSHPRFNYIVVFLLPGQEFPQFVQAGIFIQLSSTAPFTPLGTLSAEKPSAIFRIRNNAAPGDVITVGIELKQGVPGQQIPVDMGVVEEAEPTDIEFDMDTGAQQQQQQEAAIPPGAIVVTQEQATALKKELAKKIIENMKDFVSSDIVKGMLPYTRLTAWETRFWQKMQNNPKFLGPDPPAEDPSYANSGYANTGYARSTIDEEVD